jgi:23S rRNA pseudouridine1911/1915/1917 synthase
MWLCEARGLSRTAAQTLIAAGAVRVNGRTGRPGQRIGPRDRVEVDEPEAIPASERPDDVPVPLGVVFEDEWLAVIDKPAGMVVHPAPGHAMGTLADGLRQRGSTWSLAGGADRPGIVHRLDRFTSGLLIVAKTEAAHRALSAQLASRTLGRLYWALVWKTFNEDSGEIEAPIGRDPRQRQRMAVIDAGRPAWTDFIVTERHRDTTVLDVSLRTGRTHQIRVHLNYIKHPIVGDPLYGRRGDRHSGRPALHARQLRFKHPVDGSERVIDSPLPADLVALLELARGGLL